MRVLSVLCVAALAAVAMGQGYPTMDGSYEQFEYEHDPVWTVSGRGGFVTGGYGQPGGQYQWAGLNHHEVDATLEMELDTEADTGRIEVKWTMEEPNCLSVTTFDDGMGILANDLGNVCGEFRMVMDTFAGGQPWQEGGVATNIFIHGKPAPVVPKSHAYLASFGPGQFYVNDEPVLINQNTDEEIPLFGHMMITERWYHPDGTVIGGNDCDSGLIWNPMMDGILVNGTDGNTGCYYGKDMGEDPSPAEIHVNIRKSPTGSGIPSDPAGLMGEAFWTHLVFHDFTDAAGAVVPSLLVVAVAAVAALLL